MRAMPKLFRFGSTAFRRGCLAFGLLILASCGSGGSLLPPRAGSDDSKKAKVAFSQFPDLPVPEGAKINIEKTLVFGSNPWFGQLALKTSSKSDVLFDFYRRALPQHQWQEITSVRAPTSILTYVNGERVLAIAITDSALLGANVTLTVSPRGTPSPPAPAGGIILPAPVQPAN